MGLVFDRGVDQGLIQLRQHITAVQTQVPTEAVALGQADANSAAQLETIEIVAAPADAPLGSGVAAGEIGLDEPAGDRIEDEVRPDVVEAHLSISDRARGGTHRVEHAFELKVRADLVADSPADQQIVVDIDVVIEQGRAGHQREGPS